MAPLALIGHLTAGRAQMGTSLAFHLVFALLGVGLPLLMLIAEGLYLQRVSCRSCWRPGPRSRPRSERCS